VQPRSQNSPLDVEGAAELLEAMEKYTEELVKAGIVLAGDALKPSKFGKRIQFSGTKRSVTDGPFAETKELVAGYSPNPNSGPSEVGLRPLWEPEDFDPEVVAQVNANREKVGKGGK